MIAYLTGLVLGKNEKSLIVLAQSVGYKVHAPTEVLAKAEEDQKIQLYIHTAVREDDIALYGFFKKAELDFFEQLISVSGIGPKTALEILSAPIHMTQNAIVGGDISTLTKIKGLGKKTAERLILELKNKIVPISLKSLAKGAAAYNEEAVEALVSLGYEKIHVMKALNDLPATVTKTEDIVRHFLKQG
jgi:holliday junction DNA helicase RuvA